MATKNTCPCPQPPGGNVACEPNQLAICRVKNGVAEGECINPPAGMDSLANLAPADATRYLNWALDHITGQQRLPWEIITPKDQGVLRRGVYHNSATGEEVRFKLPDELNLNSPTSTTGSLSGSGGPSRGTPLTSGGGGVTTSY